MARGPEGDELLLAVEDGVAVITLNRPEKLNAWTAAMESRLVAHCRAVAADERVRAVVITGAGRGFCAGADMDLLSDAASGGRMERGGELPGDPRLRHSFGFPYGFLAMLPKPVVAAVNGTAVGLGLVMTLFADVRIVAADAKLATMFSRRGLIAEWGAAWILPRLVGTGPALDLLLSGRTFSGEEAVSIGLASQAVESGRVREAALDYARELSQRCSPRSLAVIKRQVYAGLEQSLREAIASFEVEMPSALDSADVREGIDSFLERRDPRFPPLSS